MSDNENIEMTAADEADLQKLLENPQPSKHTLLEVWREILSNAEEVQAQHVHPGVANRLVSSWPKMSFQDIPAYNEMYNDLVIELRETVHEAIRLHPEALEVEDDAEENRRIYLDLLVEWQLHITRWEEEWDAAAPDSHIRVAAIADVTTFYLGNTNSLAEYLGNIGIVLTDAEREEMGARLFAAKAAQ